MEMLHAVEFSDFAVTRYGVPKRVTLTLLNSFPEDIRKYVVRMNIFLGGRWYTTIGSADITGSKLLPLKESSDLLMSIKIKERALWESRHKEKTTNETEDSA